MENKMNSKEKICVSTYFNKFDENGKPNGLFFIHNSYRNGKNKSVKFIINYENGAVVGPEIHFDIKGKLKCIINRTKEIGREKMIFFSKNGDIERVDEI